MNFHGEFQDDFRFDMDKTAPNRSTVNVVHFTALKQTLFLVSQIDYRSFYQNTGEEDAAIKEFCFYRNVCSHLFFDEGRPSEYLPKQSYHVWNSVET